MSNRHGLLHLYLAIITAAFGLVTAGHAVELDPKAVAYQTPEQFKWRDPTMAVATNQTILYGDPNKTGGIYIYINKFKPGRFGNAHSHPNDRYITVLSGTWWVGTGNKFDPANLTVPMKEGTFVTHFAKGVHWDGARDEDTTIILIGEGPATNTRVEEAK